VRAIAEAAGVTCPTLYYYFGSKEGLAQALLVRPMERLLGRLRDLLDEPLEPIERLSRMLEAHFAFSREDPDRARLVYAVMFGPHGGGLAPDVHRFIEGNEALIREAAGRLGPGVDLDSIVPALRGHAIVRCVDFLYRGGELEPGLAGRLVRAVVRGHAAPAEAASGGDGP
jgi:AcrR family transcriptional regulator